MRRSSSWEYLPRWERELRVLAAFWPPRSRRPARQGPFQPFEGWTSTPPSGIHPDIASRYLKPFVGPPRPGEIRGGYIDSSDEAALNAHVFQFPEPGRSAKRRANKTAAGDRSGLTMMFLGPSGAAPAPLGRDLLDPFQYQSPEEFLDRVVREIDELLAPLQAAPADQLLSTFRGEWEKRRGFRFWHRGDDDGARAFLEHVRLPRAFCWERRRRLAAAVAGVDIPRVAGVLLYAVTAIGWFWWYLNALDEESARRRAALKPHLKGLRSLRQREAESGLSDTTLKQIDENRAPMLDSLKRLRAAPDTGAVRWCLRMPARKPLRTWPCWTPVVGWVVSELRRQLDRDTASATVARLFNALTDRPLNSCVYNPFFVADSGRWRFRPMWSRKGTGSPLTAAIARGRYYTYEARRRRLRARRKQQKSIVPAP